MAKGWTDTGYFTIVSNYVLEDSELTAEARLVYTLLVRYGRWKRINNEKWLVTWVGRQKLAELIGVSEWSISQHIRELINKDLIERKRRPGGSSITYICDPRPVYEKRTPVPEIPDDGSIETPDSEESLELLDQETDSASLAPANVIVSSSQRRGVPEPTTGTDGIAQETPSAPANQPTADSEKDVDSQDITILSDNSRASPGGTDRNGSRPTATAEDTGQSCPEPRVHGNPLRGIMARRANVGLTTRSKTRVAAPADAIGVDEDDIETARDVFNEFQRLTIESYSGVTTYQPTEREVGNCRKLLKEFSVDDIAKMFELAVRRWAVVRERWPQTAKSEVPTFYAVFSLRRQLMPIAQAGKGLSSRTHRDDAEAWKDVPSVGWGEDE